MLIPKFNICCFLITYLAKYHKEKKQALIAWALRIIFKINKTGVEYRDSGRLDIHIRLWRLNLRINPFYLVIPAAGYDQ